MGHFLKWRHSRTVLQIPLLLISVAMILHGLFGPTFAPKNLATVLTWVQFRGALVLILLCAGNFFCLACPFMLVRNAARRFFLAPAGARPGRAFRFPGEGKSRTMSVKFLPPGGNATRRQRRFRAMLSQKRSETRDARAHSHRGRK